jgi:soluble cytochrome b562
MGATVRTAAVPRKVGLLQNPTNKDPMMVDYSEGYLELKQLVDKAWQLILDQKFAEARALCDEIVVTARLTKAQIGVQHDGQ